MGLLSFFGGSKKAIDDVMDKDNGHLAKIGHFIGSQQFTDQERAEATLGLATAVRQFAIATASENTERSKARRSLAEDWLKLQIFLVLLSAVLRLSDSSAYTDIWSMTISTLMTYGTGAVMLYYFGSYGWGAHVQRKKN